MQKQLLTIISLLIINLGLSQSFFQDNFNSYTYSNFQTLPKVSYPFLKYSMYKNSQSKYLIKNTAYFQLNGNVKSVKETVKIKDLSNSSREDKIEFDYYFLENNNLSKYQEYYTQGSDSIKTLRNEEYFYDDLGKTLKNIIAYFNIYSSYKINILFDSLGYIETETYELLSHPNYKKEIDSKEFDYTLNYEWNKNWDSLYLNFLYKSQKYNYYKYQNRTYSFAKMKNDTLFEKEIRLNVDGSLDEVKEMKLYRYNEYYDTNNLYQTPISESRLIDYRGNTVMLTIYDNLIKSSYSTDVQYKYKYNEKSEIIEISFYTSNWLNENEFDLSHRIKINYLKHDNKGNWTSKKVTNYRCFIIQDVLNNKGIDSTVFIYNREIEYY